MYTAFVWTVYNSQATEPSERFRYFAATEMCLNAVAPCNFDDVLDILLQSDWKVKSLSEITTA